MGNKTSIEQSPNTIEVTPGQNTIRGPETNKIQRQSKIFRPIHSSEIHYSYLKNAYESSTAYSLQNRDTGYPLFRQDNSLTERFKRFYNEKYTIIDQNYLEKLNTLFTITLIFIAFYLFIYVSNHNLVITTNDYMKNSVLNQEYVLSNLIQDIGQDNYNTLSENEKINKLKEKENNLVKERDEKTDSYYNMKNIYGTVQFVSGMYVLILGSYRIFLRTTV